MKRRSIMLDGFAHGEQPIPAASRLGPLLITGGIHGADRQTGKLPVDPGDQIRLMFNNLMGILTEGGASLDNVARLTVYLGSPAYRSLVNEHWIAAFPDPAARPARHTMLNPNLPAGMHVQCEAIAYIPAS